MNQISLILTTVLLVCTFSTAWGASNNNFKGLRGMLEDEEDNTTSVLKCRVMYVDTEYSDPTENEEAYMCMPVVNETVSELAYPMTLPEEFLTEFADKLYASDRDILIDGGEVIGDNIIIPDGAIIQLVRKSRVVTFADEFVVRKTLIVRVSTTDKRPSLTAAEMSEKTFGDRSLTLRSQYLACSHGKLTFDPAPNNLADDLKDGVLDISLDVKAKGMTRQALTNAAIQATQKALGSAVGDVVDNLIVCHPPGTEGKWVAYAFPNSAISVYNDKWCGYLSATMHEVGHNLGFLHSNQDGLYNDKTGYMGFSYEIENWPSVCFNGQKNWQAGWFSDRAIEVDPSKGIWRGKLATFVDYHLTGPTENVVIKVGDLYLQYNRAKGINFQTRERQNQLTIVEERPKGSELLAGVDGIYYNSTLYRQENYGENGETLFVAVCSTHLGDNTTKPDVMIVSVGLDGLDCATPATEAPTESPAPSPSPSMTPTTEVPPDPNADPTPAPTTLKIFIPTAPTTSKPSWIAPDRGDTCDDDMEATFLVGERIGYQNCKWLQEMPEMHEYLCVKGFDAYNMCAETCGKCSDDCEDSDTNLAVFAYKGSFHNCKWLREQPPTEWETICNDGFGTIDHCRETCNSCPTAIDNHESCDDSQVRTFPVYGVGNRRCSWLSQPDKTLFREAFCVPENPIFHLCAETCGKCFDNCNDNPAATFLYNGQDRNCQWLSTKPLQWEAACGRRQIRNSCPESCENCG